MRRILNMSESEKIDIAREGENIKMKRNRIRENKRRVTNDVISAIDDGFLSWEVVGRACLEYLSEDDVNDMVNLNGWSIATDDELNESTYGKMKRNRIGNSPRTKSIPRNLIKLFANLKKEGIFDFKIKEHSPNSWIIWDENEIYTMSWEEDINALMDETVEEFGVAFSWTDDDILPKINRAAEKDFGEDIGIEWENFSTLILYVNN